ncbi:MAG: 50S ribosomal protein L35 [Dehalococcoidia bacterium]|nr:MAG: 50S ribosomal protein L35 [Dehalococcoidia bacterium]
MPKLKTHKAASRRFHVTGSGKIMRTKGGKSHLRRKKSKRAKRLYDEKLPLHPSDKARIKRLLPYA